MAEMTAREMTPAASPRAFERMRGWAQSVGLLWVLFILCGVAVWLSPNFIQIGNLLNVGRQVALFGIVSVGMTFVILTRGIDLSVGSIVGVVAVSQRHDACRRHADPAYGGRRAGARRAARRGQRRRHCLFGMPPFIMTLGMLVIGRGIAMTHRQRRAAEPRRGVGYLLLPGRRLPARHPGADLDVRGDRPDRVRGAAPYRLRPPDLRRGIERGGRAPRRHQRRRAC